jgi:CubicO group peptidase (beta-lactamase class C family)
MVKKLTLIILLIGVLSFGCSKKQSIDMNYLNTTISTTMQTQDEMTKEVDALFEHWEKEDSPGSVVGIIKDGRLIYSRGYGMACLEYNIPLTPQTKMNLASVSKQFTAMAIAILVGNGTISLDDDIRKYIPELHSFSNPITIRHLVHHQSGFRDYNMIMNLTGNYLRTHKETLNILYKQKGLNFIPGEKFSYCNSGYFLLCELVERVTGQTLAEFSRKHIFEPLKMSDTMFKDNRSIVVKERAFGYKTYKNAFRRFVSTRDFVGAGGVFTTIDDLAKWDANFYDNKLGKSTNELISLFHETGKLKNGEKTDYAFGVYVNEYRGLQRIRHGGNWDGFNASYWRFPDQKLSIMVLANLNSISTKSLARQIAEIYLKDYFEADAEISNPSQIVTNSNNNKQIDVTIEQLIDYIGIFYSDEIDVTYEIGVPKDNLCIKALNGNWIDLTPIQNDRFKVDYITIDFKRGLQDKVSYFLLDAGERVIDLKFNKVK